MWQNKEVISDAKKELGIIEKTVTGEEKNTVSNNQQEREVTDDIDKNIMKEEKKKFEIIKLTQNQVLDFDDISEKDFSSWEIEISGKTLEKVDKIKVNFTNEDSDFPDDSYILTQFKTWDESFLYRALSRYETLDFWTNKYVFFAYSWDEITKTELIIYVENPDEKSEDGESEVWKIIEKIDEIAIADLPVSTDSWYPIQIWDNKLTYSGLKWLEISKKWTSDLTCENITDFLEDSLNTWFYWNTCRKIEEDKWYSYFVLRLDWERYVYEKHYIIFKDLSYWVYEIETGTGVTKDTIAEKNTELKEKNEDYPTLDIVDKLFIDLSK